MWRLTHMKMREGLFIGVEGGQRQAKNEGEQWHGHYAQGIVKGDQQCDEKVGGSSGGRLMMCCEWAG